jgi:hypothetical protein
MRVRMLIIVMLLGFGLSAQAQPGGSFLAGGWTCEELKQACKDDTAENIYYGALLGPGGTVLGTCYVHDKSSCPNCACWDYVKLSYKENPKGWDGGTGCMGLTSATSRGDSFNLAAAKLKELCESGACCCPNVEPKPCAVQAPVKARDPITGSCCTFPNPCSAPTDWEAPIAPNDERCN